MNIWVEKRWIHTAQLFFSLLFFTLISTGEFIVLFVRPFFSNSTKFVAEDICYHTKHLCIRFSESYFYFFYFSFEIRPPIVFWPPSGCSDQKTSERITQKNQEKEINEHRREIFFWEKVFCFGFPVNFKRWEWTQRTQMDTKWKWFDGMIFGQHNTKNRFLARALNKKDRYHTELRQKEKREK